MQFERLAGDLGRTEGPVFAGSGDVLVTSMDRGHLYSVDADGVTARVMNTGGEPNGLTEGPDGRLYVAQNGGRGPWNIRPICPGGVQVVDPVAGSLRWLTMDPVSPNDLCFGPDGALYVTDPTRTPARNDGRLWRVDPLTGVAVLLRSVPWYPNGIGFGPEPDFVYVASTGESVIRRIEFSPDGLGAEHDFITMPYGHPDGFAFDTDGNMIIATVGTESDLSAPGELQVWSPEGTLSERIQLGSGHYYTNVALSGDGRLIVTDTDDCAVLVADGWPGKGLPLHPHRV
ncbi:SMP-30/gluconolactonase/LRE family protein [Pseudonocardia ailaonensis]|uniref:SMP-30/gluconolactonase/LRE family protein n=1 Tax=Pseudonocardia ailaonensis TaxID=367279 RepID=A0ABN2MZC5_9PSEU